jgi:hypothetical protein
MTVCHYQIKRSKRVQIIKLNTNYQIKRGNRGKFPGGGGRSQSLESMIQALDDSAPA